MSDNKNIFYLNEVFPKSEEIFSSEYKNVDVIFKNGIIVLDTNVLLVPYDTTEKNLSEIKSIFQKLKQENRLLIPSRVSREFAKNRGKKISEVFLKIRQTKNNLNHGAFKLEDYPILDELKLIEDLKEEFTIIKNAIKKSRKILTKIEEEIKLWNWNDRVSKVYKEVFTPDIITEVKKKEEDLIKDLKFRIQYKIPPGFKDSSKLDDGIGDLIIWQTILEIGANNKSDVLFVTNDEKNDWFTKQDHIGLYPRFELFDEFRRYTNGKSIGIISFAKLLELGNASKEAVEEVKINYSDDFDHLEKVNKENCEVGLNVIHSKFGRGIITHIEQKNQIVLNIKFEDSKYGERRLMLRFAKLYIPNKN